MVRPVQVFEGQGAVCQHCHGKGCHECNGRGEDPNQYHMMDLSGWCGGVSFGNDRIVFFDPKPRLVKVVTDITPPFRLRHLPLHEQLEIGIGDHLMHTLAVTQVEVEEGKVSLIVRSCP